MHMGMESYSCVEIIYPGNHFSLVCYINMIHGRKMKQKALLKIIMASLGNALLTCSTSQHACNH